MSVIYLNLDGNLESCTSIQARIDKVNAIIDALFTTALKSVQNGHRVEYSLDDGQSKQRVVYSNMDQVTKAIEDYEKIKIALQNQLVGRQFRNIDARNLKFRRNG
jgi:hypothetical protein